MDKNAQINMKQRIEWVDMLKGMAIFFVVFGHVEVYPEKHLEGFFYRLQDVFCMPLFFFLSGLFCKPQYSVNDSILHIKKKFIQLMIPFLVCGSLRLFFMSSKPWWALFWYPNGQGHCGYWFLLVLFELYVLFTLSQTITRKLTKDLWGNTFFVVALVIELILSIIYVLVAHKGMLVKEPWYTAISFVRLYYNFPFFILGYLFMRNKNWMVKFFCKRTYNVSWLLFAGLYVMYDKYDIVSLPLRLILSFLAVTVIVSLCRSFEDTIMKANNNCKNVIEYIGRHTLEIYVLHYFFIPRNMNYLRDIIVPNNLMDVNIILELIINSCIACAIIGVTLCCAFLIRENAYLKLLFFGKH